MTVNSIKTFFMPAAFLLLWGVSLDVQAQSRGSTARGGSVARDMIKDSTKGISLPDLVRYRLALKKLKINEEVLTSQFGDLQEKKANIKLKDLILAYLMIQREGSDRAYAIDEFVNFYQSEQDFYKSFRNFFSLDEAVFESRKSDATSILKNATKKQ